MAGPNANESTFAHLHIRALFALALRIRARVRKVHYQSVVGALVANRDRRRALCACPKCIVMQITVH